MKQFATTAARASKGLGRREISSLPQLTMNYVGSRDLKQTAWGNEGDPSCAQNLEAIAIVDEINTKGPAIIKYVEGGGQMNNEFTKIGEDKTSFDLYAQYHAAMPNATKIRSLTRIGFGNGTENIAISDYQKYMTRMHEAVEGNMVPKLFSYKYDEQETKQFIEATQRAGFNEIELAAAISSRPSFLPFFEKKFLGLLQTAQEYGCSHSLKIMSPHMDLEKGSKIFNIAAKEAASLGFEESGAHIHLPSVELVSAFLGINKQFGLRCNVDFAHQGNGYFSGWRDVLEAADKAGITVSITPEQERLFQDLDKVASREFKMYQGIILPDSFLVQEYQDYGIPGGGAAYSVAAIKNSHYARITQKGTHTPLLSPEETKQVFLAFYEQANLDTGECPPVTPGHKRAETTAIHAADKNLNADVIEKLRDENGVLNIDKIKEFAASLTCEQKYSGLNAKMIDAIRGDDAPVPLSPQMKKFVCEEHMRNFLKAKDLPQESKDLLVAAALNKEEIQVVANRLQLDKNAIEELVQHSGQRQYTESSSAKPRYAKALAEIKALNTRGAKIENIEDKALDSAALHGGSNQRLEYHGQRPDPANMDRATFEVAKQEFYIKNHKTLKEVGQEYAIDHRSLVQAATDGYVSGGSILAESYSTSNDNKPNPSVKATAAVTVVTSGRGK